LQRKIIAKKHSGDSDELPVPRVDETKLKRRKELRQREEMKEILGNVKRVRPNFEFPAFNFE